MLFIGVTVALLTSIAGLVYGARRGAIPPLFLLRLTPPLWARRIFKRFIAKKRQYEGRTIEVLGAIIKGDGDELDDVLNVIKAKKPNFDINSNKGGSTLLCIAARAQRSTECVKVLIRHGADINAPDLQGVPPIIHAARNGNHDSMEILIENGAEWDIADSDSWTPLHYTALNGRETCAKILLDKGANPNCLNDTGATPCWCACNSGHATTLQLLIKYGGDVTIPNNTGNTPLHAASNNGCISCIPLLLRNGVDINALNNNLETALHKAARKGHKMFVEELVAFDRKRQLSELISLLTKDGFKQEEYVNIQKTLQHIATTKRGEYFFSICQNLCIIIESNAMKIISSKEDNIESNIRAFSDAINTLRQITETMPKDEIIKTFEDSPFSEIESIWRTLDSELEYLNESQPLLSSSSGVSADNKKFERLCPVLNGLHRLCASGVEDILMGSSRKQRTLESKRLVLLISKHKNIFVSVLTRSVDMLTGSLDFILEHSALLEIPEIKPLVRLLPFDQKRNWLKNKLQMEKQHAQNVNLYPMDIIISRESIFSDSCNSFQFVNGAVLKSGLNVRFAEEEGSGPGVQREWFRVLIREMFNQDNALFIQTPQNTFQPNPCSFINPDHLSYFYFVGQVIALAIFHNEYLDVHFTRPFYKHMLGIPVSWTDVESLDSEYFKNLHWILSNNINDAGLDLTFSSDVDNFGVVEIVDLKPNGRNIPVTNENKQEYVQLLSELKITGAISAQIEHFLAGFHSILPKAYVALFNEYEIELLISGSPDIDVADWEDNTAYIGFTKDDEIIRWFWRAVGEFTQDQKAHLLQFVSGSARVPLGGFGQLRGVDGITKFTITKAADASVSSLPTASTCFNLLRLPLYTSYEQLQDRLLISITHGSSGFSFS